MPFEPFERYSPYGTPEDVAEFLRPYIEAGCSTFNVIPCADDDDERDRTPSANFESCSRDHEPQHPGIAVSAADLLRMRPRQPRRLPSPQLPRPRLHRRRVRTPSRARQRLRLCQRRHHRHRSRLSWRSCCHVGGCSTGLERPHRQSHTIPDSVIRSDVPPLPTPLGPPVQLNASPESIDPSRIIVRSEMTVDDKVRATMTASWAPIRSR